MSGVTRVRISLFVFVVATAALCVSAVWIVELTLVREAGRNATTDLIRGSMLEASVGCYKCGGTAERASRWISAVNDGGATLTMYACLCKRKGEALRAGMARSV